MERTKRILIIEDEPDIASAVAELLEAFGFAVDMVRHGKQGLELLKQSPPDILLLDMTLPDMDGYHILHDIRLRERRHEGRTHLPVLVMTGRGLPTQILCETEGIDGFLQKPFGQGELLEALARILHTHSETIEKFGV